MQYVLQRNSQMLHRYKIVKVLWNICFIHFWDISFQSIFWRCIFFQYPLEIWIITCLDSSKILIYLWKFMLTRQVWWEQDLRQCLAEGTFISICLTIRATEWVRFPSTEDIGVMELTTINLQWKNNINNSMSNRLGTEA